MNKFLSKILCTGLIITLPFFSEAQPTLTASMNNPVAGDVFNQYNCDTAGVVYGSSGASATWNYSTLAILPGSVGDSFHVVSFVSCSATPYCDSFQAATVATFSKGYHSSSGVVIIDTTYGYYSTSASRLGILGFGYPQTFAPGYGLDSLSPYENILSYPFTYTNTANDSFNSFFYDPAYGSTYGKEIDTATADGYGTLILPTGTYNNVLRIHTIRHIYDTLIIVGMGTIQAAGPTGVNNIISNEPAVAIYPNPAKDELHIRYNSFNGQYATIFMTDIMGRAVAAENDNTGMVTLSLATIPNGIYMLRIQTGNNIDIEKIEVLK